MKKNARIICFLLCIVVAVPLCFTKPSEIERVNAASNEGTVTDNLNVRTGAGTNYSKLTYNGANVVLAVGTKVTIIDTVTINNAYNPKWYKVSFTKNGTSLTGYVSASYVNLSSSSTSSSDDFETMLNNEGFPESYKVYLRNLHQAHPNWTFKSLQTGLSWNDVIKNEAVLGRSLVQNIRDLSYRSTAAGAYNWTNDTYYPYDGSTWYCASDAAIAYCMDPRNYLDEANIFQFEALSYDSSTQTSKGVSCILNGSFMNNDTYINYFVSAASYSGVSPYHLASRAVQEVGKNGSGSTSGTYSGYAGYYNFYNIGATSGSNPIANGLNFAKNGTSNATTNSLYKIPWNTKEKAIVGGAYFIGSSYINLGQNTLYLEKFDVDNTYKGIYWHQYMTNIEAPRSEASKIYTAYNSYGMLSNSMTFIIPVYLNMPSTACAKPANSGSPNNWLKSLSVNGYSLTPTFAVNSTNNYSLIVPYSVSSISISAATVNSSASISGSISGSSTASGSVNLNEGNNLVSINVKAANGDVRTYNLTVVRQPFTGTSSGSTSDNGNQTNNSGNTGLTGSYTVSNNVISGISIGTSYSTFISKLGNSSGSTVSITNSSGSTISSGNVGTGNLVTVSNGSNKTQYSVVIYGDVNGDGNVNAVDLLMVRKVILGTYSVSGSSKIAADVNKDGAINAVDLLMVRKQILGTYKISQ